MTANEKTVMNGLMDLLDRFNDPPAPGASDEATWWTAECDALCEFGNRCRNHPLAIEAGAALHTYLEIKSKAKGSESK